jgi:hypothetical protein
VGRKGVENQTRHKNEGETGMGEKLAKPPTTVTKLDPELQSLI